MDRRSFIVGLLAIAAGGSAALAASEAAAATSASEACLDVTSGEASAAIPDGLPLEFAQYHGRSAHWHHRNRRYRHHRRHVRRRHVCRVHIDRWGRRVRRCHWVWI